MNKTKKIASSSQPETLQTSENSMTDKSASASLKQLSTKPLKSSTFSSTFRRSIPTPWPALYQMHVRGDDNTFLKTNSEYTSPIVEIPDRKLLSLKRKKTYPSSLKLNPFLEKYSPLIPKVLADEEKARASTEFPIPNIHLSKQVKFSNDEIKDLVKNTITNPESLSILKNILDKLPNSRSAYERHEYETQCWTSKYTPQTSISVLTNDSQGVVVRDWIVNRIKFLATIKSKELQALSQKKKKKKKRNGYAGSDMDDFIVDDDEIEYASDSNSHSKQNPKSCEDNITSDEIEESLPDLNQPEILILYGPPGSGKTSSVYAACKELDIYVFESHPGERRSGKLIMEKLDGMSRSHLVHHRKDDGPKKGGLFGFLKPASKPSVPKQNEVGSNKVAVSGKNPPHKLQKSVILFDDADILFDDESSFWSAIERFLETTRRPVIITCTDPTKLSPDIYNKHFDGLMMFSPASVDIQADALWVIALCEGHLIERDYLKSLVQENNLDFRKSLNHLQFWCQMAIGDRPSGINWFYNTSVIPDKDGVIPKNIPRYISKDTYIGIDLKDTSNETEKITDYDMLDNLDINSRVTSKEDTSTGLSLDSWATFCDSLSDADILETHSHSLFAVDHVVDNLSTISKDLELASPADHVIGDFYISSSDSASIPSECPRLSFETSMYQDLVIQAQKTVSSLSSSRNNNDNRDDGNTPVLTLVPKNNNELTTASKSSCEKMRETLVALSANPGSYATTVSYYNSIDCTSSSVMGEEIGPYGRIFAREDLKRELLVEKFRQKYESIIGGCEGITSMSSVDSITPIPTITTTTTDTISSSVIPPTSTLSVPGTEPPVPESIITVPTPNEIIISDTSNTGRNISTRGTMRSVYASLGHSAADFMALTRRYLPPGAYCKEIINTAPENCLRLYRFKQ